MKTLEELNAIKAEVESINSKLANLTAEEMAQVVGSKGLETFSVGDWIMTECFERIRKDNPDPDVYWAYQVIEVSGTLLTVQEIIYHKCNSTYSRRNLTNAATYASWHVAKPWWY